MDHALASETPCALIIEDDEMMAAIYAQKLAAQGWSALVFGNLIAAIPAARRLWSPDTPSRPLLMLLDMHLPLPLDLNNTQIQAALEIDSWHIAAWLNQAMHTGRIHPATLIAMSNDMTPERRQYATLCGCTEVWEKPLRQQHWARTEAIYAAGPAAPPSIPAHDQRLQALAAQNIERVEAIFAALITPIRPSVQWDANAVRLVLGIRTPAIRLSSQDEYRALTLSETLGGPADIDLAIHEWHTWLLSTQREAFAPLLHMLTTHQSRSAMQTALNISWRKLDQMLNILYRLIAVYLNNHDHATAEFVTSFTRI